MIIWNQNIMPTREKPLGLDIFVPESSSLRGAVLFLHGGGFVGGRKEQFLGICAALSLQTGWVCASLEYRLAPEVHYPGQLQDVQAAIEYLTENAQELSIDVSKILLAGGSPGGCIAAQGILTDAITVSGCILLNGIVNIPAFAERNPEEQVNLQHYIPNREDWQKLSPHSLVSQNVAETEWLLLHGHEDTIVTPEDLQEFAYLLQKHGASVRIEILPGQKHAWFNDVGKQPNVIEIMASFIRAQS